MGFWDFFKTKRQPEKQDNADVEAEYLQSTVDDLLRIINESLEICENTKNLETKRSRAGVAEDKLNELKKLCKEYGSITLESLTETELLISKYKTETGIGIDREFDDLVKGFIFQPTLKLKTPLWLLEKSGEVFSGDRDDCPQYGDESQGFWTIKIDPKYDFLKKGATCASDGGQVIQEQYLVYAKSFRKIVEGDCSAKEKIKQINELPTLSSTHRTMHNQIVSYHNGIEKLHDYAFANHEEKIKYYYDTDGYLGLIYGLKKAPIELLVSSGVNTIHQLSKMSDEDLLAIKGIGKVSLERIRESLGVKESL